jgi:Dolichyl-phosphate-mannose-protein mannosyltransferase
MGMALACLAMLLPVLAGGLVWRRVAPDATGLETVGYGAAVGVVLVGLEMILTTRLGAHYSLVTLLAPLALAAAACLISGPRGRGIRSPADGSAGGDRVGVSGGIALALIVAEAGLVVWQVVQNPKLADWDGWAIWGIKAKAFFLDRTLHEYLTRVSGHAFSWPARPCLSSLFQAFVYLCLGRVDEGAARLAHVALSGALVLIVYASLRRRFGRNESLVWSAVLVTMPNFTYQCSAGIGNGALGLYLFAALAALDGWESRQGLRHLAGAALLLGGAFLARDEGPIMGALVALAAFGICPPASRPGWRATLLSCAAVLLAASSAYVLWRSLDRAEHVWDIRTTWLDPDLPSRLVHHARDTPAIFRMMARELVVPGRQARSSPLENRVGVALFWPLFGIACLSIRRWWRTDAMGARCAVVVGGGLLAYAFGFVAFPYRDLAGIDERWIFVLDRHVIAFAPMAVRAMASALPWTSREAVQAPPS